MENDLISRSALIAEHCDGCNAIALGQCDHDVCGAAQLIMEAPAVDAVEVVRCKDCIYYETGKDYLPYCNHPDSGIAYFPEKDDFCSYGERKADDATG